MARIRAPLRPAPSWLAARTGGPRHERPVGARRAGRCTRSAAQRTPLAKGVAPARGPAACPIGLGARPRVGQRGHGRCGGGGATENQREAGQAEPRRQPSGRACGAPGQPGSGGGHHLGALLQPLEGCLSLVASQGLPVLLLELAGGVGPDLGQLLVGLRGAQRVPGVRVDPVVVDQREQPFPLEKRMVHRCQHLRLLQRGPVHGLALHALLLAVEAGPLTLHLGDLEQPLLQLGLDALLFLLLGSHPYLFCDLLAQVVDRECLCLALLFPRYPILRGG
ncbi:unnamed protein product [Prorocentrum cordatum]|uniref:Uncharacterized protein n=1 Tax=Prorocentrum cordatum TaxID=2364126 RepID=A0ABN9YIX9_9DINO|nr:unnamed protein product [Polarella glacialis]